MLPCQKPARSFNRFDRTPACDGQTDRHRAISYRVDKKISREPNTGTVRDGSRLHAADKNRRIPETRTAGTVWASMLAMGSGVLAENEPFR